MSPEKLFDGNIRATFRSSSSAISKLKRNIHATDLSKIYDSLATIEVLSLFSDCEPIFESLKTDLLHFHVHFSLANCRIQPMQGEQIQEINDTWLRIFLNISLRETVVLSFGVEKIFSAICRFTAFWICHNEIHLYELSIEILSNLNSFLKENFGSLNCVGDEFDTNFLLFDVLAYSFVSRQDSSVLPKKFAILSQIFDFILGYINLISDAKVLRFVANELHKSLNSASQDALDHTYNISEPNDSLTSHFEKEYAAIKSFISVNTFITLFKSDAKVEKETEVHPLLKNDLCTDEMIPRQFLTQFLSSCWEKQQIFIPSSMLNPFFGNKSLKFVTGSPTLKPLVTMEDFFNMFDCPSIPLFSVDLQASTNELVSRINVQLNQRMIVGHDVLVVKSQDTSNYLQVVTGQSIHSQAAINFFEEGFTLVLRGANQRSVVLSLITQRLQASLGFPIDANLYLTPPNCQGLSAHYDNHCVFVLQIHGSKKWKLGKIFNWYPEYMDLPIVPTPKHFENAEELILNEGDFLYIPKGQVHVASTTNLSLPSLHLSCGVETSPMFTWASLLHVAIQLHFNPTARAGKSDKCDTGSSHVQEHIMQVCAHHLISYMVSYIQMLRRSNTNHLIDPAESEFFFHSIQREITEHLRFNKIALTNIKNDWAHFSGLFLQGGSMNWFAKHFDVEFLFEEKGMHLQNYLAVFGTSDDVERLVSMTSNLQYHRAQSTIFVIHKDFCAKIQRVNFSLQQQVCPNPKNKNKFSKNNEKRLKHC